MSSKAKWRLWIFALVVAFSASSYLVGQNWQIGALREAARVAAKWDSRDRAREPTQRELDALPKRARFMIDSQCNEGGDPRVQRNCYGEAAEWMLAVAKEQEPRRDLGLAGMLASVLLGVSSSVARRNARKRELFYNNALPP